MPKGVNAVLELYHFPGACSRVTMHALEKIGTPFADVLVNFREQAQTRPAYLTVNPKGKVPVLRKADDVLTENAAILWTLAEWHPEAELLPLSGGTIDRHRCLADLVWCSSTMHPMVRQICMPMKWTTGEEAGVRKHGIEALAKECERRSSQIADGWWYGATWSIVDTYFYWGYSTAAKGGFPLERFPSLIRHAERVRSLASFQRVLDRERAALEKAGIYDISL